MKKVIDIDDVKFGSLNRKYKRNFYLTKEYREFKKLLIYSCKKVKASKPYIIEIRVHCYQDIDNVIKPILDALEFRKIIDNDRNVQEIVIHKNHIKKNELGKLQVWII